MFGISPSALRSHLPSLSPKLKRSKLRIATSSDDFHFTHHLSEHVSCHFSHLFSEAAPASLLKGTIPPLRPSGACLVGFQSDGGTVRIRTHSESPILDTSRDPHPDAKTAPILRKRPFPDISCDCQGNPPASVACDSTEWVDCVRRGRSCRGAACRTRHTFGHIRKGRGKHRPYRPIPAVTAPYYALARQLMTTVSSSASPGRSM